MAWLHDWKQSSHTAFASQQIKWDTDGNGWLYCYSATIQCSAHYPYCIQKSEYGWTATTLFAQSDIAGLHYVGVAKTTISTANYGWYQIGGYCSNAILTSTTGTIGDAIKEASGTVLTVGTTDTGLANAFAVFAATGADNITHCITLFPVMIDGQD